jgi:segregation and condensation protein B
LIGARRSIVGRSAFWESFAFLRPEVSAALEAQSLGFNHLTAPDDDQGLSLDELSQAYVALLRKGSDPYPETPAEPGESPECGAAADEQLLAAGREDDGACAVCPRSILEAILFVGHPAGEPLASERVAALMRGVRPAEIDDLVAELNAEYEADGAPYEIVSVGAGYLLTLRPPYASLREAFYGRIREARLSQAAIDVLAIIAYHQPISGAEIDRLRGKPSAAIVSQLVRREMIRVERSLEKGAAVQYRTTNRFLELIGLEDLAELPRSQDVEQQL